MAGLIFALAFLGVPIEPDPIAAWRPLIDEAAARYALPADWIERVMRAESGGRTTVRGRPIRSRVGAMGLMQLMPGTWADMRALHGLGGDPDAPRDNILAGTAYLRFLYDRFGYPGLFAAYNAGPARYADTLAGRARLPVETRVYLARIAGPGVAVPFTVPPASLFALRHDGIGTAPPSPDRPVSASIFAIEARSR